MHYGPGTLPSGFRPHRSSLRYEGADSELRRGEGDRRPCGGRKGAGHVAGCAGAGLSRLAPVRAVVPSQAPLPEDLK
jgi:hypothetical protein